MKHTSKGAADHVAHRSPNEYGVSFGYAEIFVLVVLGTGQAD